MYAPHAHTTKPYGTYIRYSEESDGREGRIKGDEEIAMKMQSFAV